MASYANQAETSARQSEVSEQLNRISNETEQIGNLVEKLRDRLSSVIRTFPCDPEKNPSPEPALCGLAANLREINRRLGSSANILDTILNSIEL